MIFVRIGRGYVENISQYIYYTRNTTPFWYAPRQEDNKK